MFAQIESSRGAQLLEMAHSGLPQSVITNPKFDDDLTLAISHE